jgi:hypothetical protein
MALKANEQAIINLVINGEQAKTSLREVTGAVNALTAELSRAKAANDPVALAKAREEWTKLKDVQKEMRAELFQTTEAVHGFFSDFKKGFAELQEIAEHVTIGTLIYKGVNFAIEGIKELWDGAKQAYDNYVRAETQLDQVLRTTSGVAGETKEALEKYQKTLMAQDGISEAVVAKGEEMLLTFTNIRGKIYDQALPAIIDMTAALNGGRVTMEGVQENAIKIGKALNDPINNMGALKKAGVTLNDQQKEQIKTFVHTNDLMSAQAIILKELQKEFGGTAKAIADTDVGKLQSFETSWDRLKEKIGRGIVDSQVNLASFFQPIIEGLAKTGTAGQQAVEAFDAVNEKFKTLSESLTPLIDRYDQLSSKSKLSKSEQSELHDIIKKVAEICPQAVTGVDDYGKAMAISTGLAKDFLKSQKDLLAYMNKDAIEKTTSDIENYTEKLRHYNQELKEGWTEDKIASFFGAKNRGLKLTDVMRADIVQKVAELGILKKGAEEALDKLQGKETEKAKEPEKPQTGYTQAELDAIARKREAERKQLQEYQNQLRETRDQVDQLIAGATKGTLEGLDQQLKVIDEKYKKLIDKLQQLNANKHSTEADRSTNNKQIKELKIDDTAAQLLATNDADYKNDLAALKSQNMQKQSLLTEQYDKQLITQKHFNEEKDKLDEKGLQDEYYLAVYYGASTLDIEKKLADAEIRNGKRVADEHVKNVKLQQQVDHDYLKAKEGIEAAKAQLVTAGFSVVNEIFGKNKALMLAELAIEDFVAIGKIKAQEGVEIAGYFAKYALVPGGEFIAAGLAAAAETRADLSIAEIIVTSIGKGIGVLTGGSSPKAAKGGLFDGPSHAQGGLNVVDTNTGRTVANVEGGEPWMVLSKETQRNNGALINQLLFNSMFRNGAAVDVKGINNGIQVARNGSLFSQQLQPNTGQNTPGLPATITHNTDLASTNEILQALHDKFDEFAKKPWTFPMRQFYIEDERIKKIQGNSKA